MSTISDQTTLDSLRAADLATYTDRTDTLVTGTALVRSGYIITTPAVLSTTVGANFTVDSGIVNTNRAVLGDGSNSWSAGNLTITNSQIVSTHETGSNQWPGWGVADQANRPVYNFSGSTIRLYSGTDGTLTNHFGNMALSGNDFTNLTFEAGAVFIPFGAVPLVNVTFSGGADTSSSVTGLVYYRLNRATSGGAPKLTAAFTGFFNCDLTAWDDTSRSVTQAVQTADSDFTTLSVYFVDGTFSDSWRNNGGVHLRNTSLDGNSKEQINYSGQSFLPAFYTTATTTEVTDVVYDAGDRTIHLMLAEGTDNTTLPEIVPQIGSNNYVTYYDSGTARPGIMFQQATSTVSGDDTLVTIDIDYETITDIPYWSYTNRCYTNGSVDTINHSRATLTGDMVVDSSDVSAVEMSMDGFLNGKTYQQAVDLRTGGGVISLDDVYPVLKSLSYENRDTTRSYKISGASIEFSIETVIFTDEDSEFFSNRTDVNVGTTLTGGSTIDTIKSASGRISVVNTTISDISIETESGIIQVISAIGNNVSLTAETGTIDLLSLGFSGAGVDIATGTGGSILLPTDDIVGSDIDITIASNSVIDIDFGTDTTKTLIWNGVVLDGTVTINNTTTEVDSNGVLLVVDLTVISDIGAPSDFTAGTNVTQAVQVPLQTRLDIILSPLGNGIPYSLYKDDIEILTGISNSSDLQLSDSVGDEIGTTGVNRTQVNNFAGVWTLGIVDFDKRCTFRGITVENNTSLVTALDHRLTLPSFNTNFGVSTVDVGSRTCVVSNPADVLPETKTVFTISGCTKNSYADERMTSSLFAGARKSVNYIESMRRQYNKDGIRTLTTDILTQDSIVIDMCQPVISGANLREGRYLLRDAEAGVQQVDGLRNVLDDPSFNGTSKTERQLRDIDSEVESDGTHKVKTASRLLASAAETAAVTLEELKDPLNNIGDGIEDASLLIPTDVPLV